MVRCNTLFCIWALCFGETTLCQKLLKFQRVPTLREFSEILVKKEKSDLFFA